MNESIAILAGTAAIIGLGHTLAGPDHYVPLIVMSKARNWSLQKTLWITLFCGVGHVIGSVALGLIGASLGIALGKLEMLEAWRGNLAAQLLIAFGFTYCVWGMHHAIKRKTHTHRYLDKEGLIHEHEHPHEKSGRTITPWVLFAIFVLGPCEPLIPLIMYPVAKHSFSGMLLVAGVFAFITIGTMMSVVLASSWGLRFVRLGTLERFSHALAGAAICSSGLAIQLMEL